MGRSLLEGGAISCFGGGETADDIAEMFVENRESRRRSEIKRRLGHATGHLRWRQHEWQSGANDRVKADDT